MPQLMKQGDKVVCINALSYEGLLTLGKVYEVLGGNDDAPKSMMTVMNDQGRPSTAFSFRFRFLSPRLPPPGFYEYSTGGGCKAYRRDVPAGRYILLTDGGGCGLPTSDEWVAGAVIVGIYSDDGEVFTTMTLQEFYLLVEAIPTTGELP